MVGRAQGRAAAVRAAVGREEGLAAEMVVVARAAAAMEAAVRVEVVKALAALGTEAAEAKAPVKRAEMRVLMRRGCTRRPNGTNAASSAVHLHV